MKLDCHRDRDQIEKYLDTAPLEGLRAEEWFICCKSNPVSPVQRIYHKRGDIGPGRLETSPLQFKKEESGWDQGLSCGGSERGSILDRF